MTRRLLRMQPLLQFQTIRWLGEIGHDNWPGFMFSVTQVRTSRTMQLQRVFFWKRVVQSEAADMNMSQLYTSNI